MPNETSDRNLLFGILAVQMDFITRDALVTAMHAWVLDKNKPLGAILVEQKALSPDRHALLQALVQEHIKQHHNDPQQSLAAVSSVASVKRVLEQIPDPDVQASIVSLPSPPVLRGRGAGGEGAEPADDPFATTGIGTPTSTGVRFRILRPHAKGGLGEVFVAQDEELHREVALKEIQNRHADNQESRARFMLEAEITGGLEHPGIVPVYGLGQYADGRPFYAMRFIRGDSLQDAIERFHKADIPGRDPGERALELRKLLGRFIDVCQAMQYAHDRGVLHRDLKPGNIMLGKYGETLVVDWGLAKVMGNHVEPAASATLVDAPALLPTSASGSAETVAGTALGTPVFMSPEQASGRLDLLGPGSDVYSLGATLYTLLTGAIPFEDRDVAIVLKKVQTGDFPRPQVRKPCVPAPLEAVCLRAMALNIADRYPSPRALGDDVEHWLADEPVGAYREPWTDRFGRWRRRHDTLVTSSALVLVTLIVSVFLGYTILRREQAQSRTFGQIEMLQDGPAGAVPTLLADLAAENAIAAPWLRTRWIDATLSDRQRLRIGLALADDAAVRNRLIELAQKADDPQDVLLVRDALQSHADETKTDLWKRAESRALSRVERFRLLAMLATLDTYGAGWAESAEPAADELLSVHPLYLGVWQPAFAPVRERLAPSLRKAYQANAAERRLRAAAILIHYVSDQPDVLAELLLDANEKQFALLFPKVKDHGERGVPVLLREIDRELPRDAKEESKEKLAKRQANAAVALLRLGRSDKVWPLFKHRPDPSVRSHLIHRLCPMGADSGVLVERFDNEPDVTIRRALILSLGDFGEKLSSSERERFLQKLQNLYHTDADPGLHAASEWVLRTWKQEAWLKQANDEWANDKVKRMNRLAEIKQSLAKEKDRALPQWFVNSQGQLMVVIPQSIAFAIAAKPVTVEEFRRFRNGHPLEGKSEKEQFEAQEQFKLYAPEPDCPVIKVSWHQAAAYCNWLSEREAIAADQWCYEVHEGQLTLNAEKNYRPKKNHLKLEGYRLPTGLEFTHAGRAGSVTKRFYGESPELLEKYAWFQQNSDDKSWRVGSLKPSDLGLFDMHGNVWSWCQDLVTVENRVLSVLCGGSYYYRARDVHFDKRLSVELTNRRHDVGFRVVRNFAIK